MSKFDKIFEARESASEEVAKPKKLVLTEKKQKPTEKRAKASKTPVPEQLPTELSPIIEKTKQRGRPKAKRSDPDYLGFTTYIRKDTHLQVKIALLQEGQGRELSELVQELLTEWLNKK